MENKANNYYGALQQATSSGFNAATTAMEVVKDIDLRGKTAIVTGGYSGIGVETVKALVAAGAEVFVPARSIGKAEENLAGIPDVSIWEMDLMDTASIKAFSDRFLALGKPLHLLINNAGVMWTPLRRDAQGNESQFSTNHLGHFQLTARLWPALRHANGARVVNVSSWGHHMASLDLDDPNFDHQPYDPSVAYARAKAANILFTVELDQRAQHHGVRAYTLHPGAISATDLAREMPAEVLVGLGVYDENGGIRHDPHNGYKSMEEGASTTVWCATSPKLNNIGGVYCEDTEVAPIDTTWKGFDPSNFAFTKGVTPEVLDPGNAKKLWTLSEQLTGVTFAI
ncbi:SDR family NAD(P)-dependent oxidoreductase [Chitinophaga arvensicola]|uniref:NAD(P)-dependent dehydrogenase, short-chain alcohol dehydrogenase family n=1 Tax=Chitinophaga arvensicola TaxID=29529 RepID=A0A1I0SAY7_9BACT|nr:SDR family NAD(P)-dependent oxidoreductase [Chitinophaga arvensicola]SEW53734.1 NAD(P)-dependent dehydrogenase, short-chain alcohol dehydrogenase family [Chitinophaga arvensicola]